MFSNSNKHFIRMLKNTLKFCIILAIFFVTLSQSKSVSSQNIARKGNKYPHHHGGHYHDLYYGGGILHYLTFLAIKAKIIFAIGAFITIIVFSGKIFAFFYYLKNKDAVRCPEQHHPSYVIAEPNFGHKYFNKPPLAPPTEHFPPEYDSGPYKRYSRSFNESFMDFNINKIKSFVQRVDLTDVAFDVMELRGKSCRKKFVCEIDLAAQENNVLGLALYFFSESGLAKYRQNASISTIEDCQNLFYQCGSSRV